MDEILPGVFHWTSFHEGIGAVVHSCWVVSDDASFVIDPREPEEGLAAFRNRPPTEAYLTNRHHYRHSDRFESAYGTRVWCHQAGLHEFTGGPRVHGFRHGDLLAGGAVALPVGALCPEETALLIPCQGGALAIGDGIIRPEGALCFVPDGLMGDDPQAVKQGLASAFRDLMRHGFDTLLLAHGDPVVGGAKDVLSGFLNRL